MEKHLKKRKAAIHSVLDEADTQLSYASNDPEKIRKCLKKSSKNSVQRAYNLGAIDAGFVGKGRSLISKKIRGLVLRFPIRRPLSAMPV
jgi:hypothetical protein